jgi:hypothetical protein
MSPAEKGTCSDSIQRYTYSVSMSKCLLFEYSGCEGNLNNFETIEECETTCDILIQMARQSSCKAKHVFSNFSYVNLIRFYSKLTNNKTY